MSDYRQRILEHGRLLTLPEVYLRLQQVLSNDDFSMQEVSEVIQYDPAITTRLLNLVRSAWLGLGTRIDTIGQAVNYLGAEAIHDLVLTTALANRFDDIRNEHFDLHSFWLRSVRTALYSRALAQRARADQAERLFVAGLIHDLGYLMMQQAIPEALEAPQSLPLEQRLEIERRQLGFDSHEISLELFENWQLPDSLRQVLAARRDPAACEACAQSAALLALASELADIAGLDADTTAPPIDPGIRELTGLGEAEVSDAIAEAEQELGSAMRLLFPHLVA